MQRALYRANVPRIRLLSRSWLLGRMQRGRLSSSFCRYAADSAPAPMPHSCHTRRPVALQLCWKLTHVGVRGCRLELGSFEGRMFGFAWSRLAAPSPNQRRRSAATCRRCCLQVLRSRRRRCAPWCVAGCCCCCYLPPLLTDDAAALPGASAAAACCRRPPTSLRPPSSSRPCAVVSCHRVPWQRRSSRTSCSVTQPS